MDGYGLELAQLAEQLGHGGASASVRSDGIAGFVFAERDPRAVELSRHGERWWVEFWSGDETAAADRFFATAAEALHAARDWLAPDAAAAARNPRIVRTAPA